MYAAPVNGPRSSSSRDPSINNNDIEKALSSTNCLKTTTTTAITATNNDNIIRSRLSLEFKNQYELLELLGRGPFSTVRRCVNLSSGISYAVKIVQVGLLKSNPMHLDLLQAIRIEARICSLLKHRHIVQLIETFEDDETLYMVFELIQGTDICSEIVTRAKSGFVYSEAVTSHYFRQLLEALAYCHKLHIIHRDLKPHCVLLCDEVDGSAPVKLGGFGSAMILSNEYSRNDDISVGTRPYIAPEVLSKGYYEYAADSWSLGVILHLLLSGCLPYLHVDCTGMRLMNDNVLRNNTKLFENISDAAWDLLKCLLEVDPTKRILPGAALNHPWIKQRVVCAPKLHLPKTIDQLVKFNRRRKLKAAILSTTEIQDDVIVLEPNEIESLNQAISVITDSLDDMQYLENPDICSLRCYAMLKSNPRFRRVLDCYFDIFCTKESFNQIDGNTLRSVDQTISDAIKGCLDQGIDSSSIQRLRRIKSNTKALLQITQAIANLGSSSRNRKISEETFADVAQWPCDVVSETNQESVESIQIKLETDTQIRTAKITPNFGMRLVQFQRHTDEPMGIALKMTEDKKCLISRIIHGGLIHRQGILQVGDEIKEINGLSVSASKLSTIQDKLLNTRGNISFKIVPTLRSQLPMPCQIYVKALFNYDPMIDDQNPCPRVGINFGIGDILKVLSKDDYEWWQAKKIPPDANLDLGSIKDCDDSSGSSGGLIPSPELQEWRVANECTLESANEQKIKDGNCGIFLKRRKYKDKYLTKHNAIFQQLDIPTYEEIVRVDSFSWKAVVLLGAHGVGRRHIKNTLISGQPDKYAYPIPHTTKLMPSSEENGKNYWFVTTDEMLADIANNGYLEYGTHKQAMYGTKLDTIRSIINRKPGMMAVLDVEPQALKVLRTAEFAPIIVFIAAPVLSEIRCIREASDDDCLERLVQESELLQQTYAHLFDISIVNIDIDETVSKLRDILEKKFYTGAQWVPAKWIY